MSAGDVTAEEMEQAIENARTAVFRDPPWSPNARAFLAILTERDQLNAEVAALRRQVEELRAGKRSGIVTSWGYTSETPRRMIATVSANDRAPSVDVVTVSREEWEQLLGIEACIRAFENADGAFISTEERNRLKRLDALRSGEAGKEAPHA